MGAEKEKPVWERIAELGFADAVDSKGFKRVGKTHWRLDGDGIVHHVKLYRGFAIEPGSFRDFQGVYIPEFDDMCRRVGEWQRSHRIPYGTALIHFEDCIYQCYVDAERSRYVRIYPESRKGRPNFTFEFLQPLPFYEPRVTVDAGSGAWLSANADLHDLARALVDSWLRYACMDLAPGADYLSYYCRVLRKSLHRTRFPRSESFILAKIADDAEMIEYLSNKLFERATLEFSTEHERVRNHRTRLAGESGLKEPVQEDALREGIEKETVQTVFGPRQTARKILRHSEILGYGLKDPGIDFGELERAERDESWGQWLGTKQSK
ncbi:hypothetical protein [Minwuia thermotolerans]|uniref:Uncharacterized protein n=1 Tax=Minwuia thermotolerans TaxID=2056226 RepID=A0A2M9G084_9PROT|nr:hypothetical protein [Minwuia thermotolerans]PJK29116.1 hypothetical protein CVT23_14495 [Minwuia thermotolerans]